VRPCQVFADEDLGIVTVFVVFQDLPGRDTELARVTDVDVITLSEGDDFMSNCRTRAIAPFMILSLGKSPRLVNHLFLENRLL
jgi:hypothetical protein